MTASQQRAAEVFAPVPLPCDPMISVVMATNRMSPYLAEALDSLAAQDYPNWECIVVIDGFDAPEAAVEVIRERLPQAQVVRQAGAGSGAARNRGVQHASGAVVAFLDDDDRWPTEMLRQHVAGFADQPEAVACYGGIRSIAANGEVFEETPFWQVDRLGIMRRDVMILNGTIAVRRDAFDAVGGFNPARLRAQDLDLVLRLADLGSFVHVAASLDYRTHSANVTGNYRLLADTIRDIVRGRLVAARRAADGEVVEAHQVSLDRNTRFAVWSALRSARQGLRVHRFGSCIGDLGWAAGHVLTTPGGLRALLHRHETSR